MIPDLTVQLGNLTLKNPVMTASGTFGYGREFADLMDLNRLGGMIVKGISLTPKKGNPPPRIWETASGMLNAIGLENVGVDAFAEKKLPFLRTLSTAVFANIYGVKEEDYGHLAARFDEMQGVHGVEVNISCPNVKAGGVAFGVDPMAAAKVVGHVRKNTKKFVMVKLSPNAGDIRPIARAVEQEGADAISLINTISGMAVDIQTKKPRLANIIGGLSGPAIKPIALRMVWEAVQTVDIPVVGIGGIQTAKDALEFILAGAWAVQVGTANFVDPDASIRILEGMEEFMRQHQIASIEAFRGTLELD